MTVQTGGSNMPNDPGVQASAWDSGWYLFENGQVKGPLSAKEAFQKTPEQRSGLLVSRKGFTQWYPVTDFAEIYNLSVRFADSVSSAPTIAKAGEAPEVRGQIIKQSLRASQNFDGPRVEPEVVIRSAQVELSSAALISQDSANLVGRSSTLSRQDSGSSPAGAQEVRKLTRKEKRRLIEEERRRRKFAARQNAVAKKAARSQAMVPPVTFEQQYLEVAGRLRLGKITSPFLSALVYTPLSFGGYWWAWFARASEEVSWHLNGASRMNFILPVWMCLIPGPHLILAYLVARMVRQIEEQNGYRTVSPALATVFALFPPLYVLKIQSALNRHWRLHVFHSVKR